MRWLHYLKITKHSRVCCNKNWFPINILCRNLRCWSQLLCINEGWVTSRQHYVGQTENGASRNMLKVFRLKKCIFWKWTFSSVNPFKHACFDYIIRICLLETYYNICSHISVNLDGPSFKILVYTESNYFSPLPPLSL